MSVPPDDPTRRLPPPVEPLAPLPPVTVAPRAVAREQVIADEAAWRQSVIDRLDGLRTGLTFMGLLAALALAVGVWTFLRERQDRQDRGGGTTNSAQVRSLRSRVNALESSVTSRATKTDLATAQQRQQDLSKRVDDLAGKASAKPAAASTTDTQARQTLDALNQTVSTLSLSVKALDDRVKALEAQPTQAP